MPDVYFQNNNRDFLNPIQMQLKYKLADIAPPVMTQDGPLPDINDYPVLNEAKAVVNIAVRLTRVACGDVGSLFCVGNDVSTLL